ncbi:uncharacterized protein BO88DRAFT_415646 [Aspergillus vadensis CBS 113365]|uniref:Uncharacterized protein n=1 Tax=Aspergillus vadensis (strain CBS 113365 / IMI 142717 / IBT 24658) TaxID=1448311 RepID=A0A319BZ83_ASPVC|nr:hypothetical protein BO88DRAFT_415646 [Aspergillus vadensis CBS 113365]PYH68478.1 hypothetical protein BO88DRAFT_415646 [Aspergillus vadensis CBS 113365]
MGSFTYLMVWLIICRAQEKPIAFTNEREVRPTFALEFPIRPKQCNDGSKQMFLPGTNCRYHQPDALAFAPYPKGYVPSSKRRSESFGVGSKIPKNPPERREHEHIRRRD